MTDDERMQEIIKGLKGINVHTAGIFNAASEPEGVYAILAFKRRWSAMTDAEKRAYLLYNSYRRCLMN